jgi:DNA topoisomerase-1
VPRLRRSSCAAPGIARRRRGRGFQYVDPAGEPVDDPEVLERIDALTIPPAWRDVWICMDPRGHLQATGVDAASRKQYLYHERWRAHRDRLKFDAMVDFGHALPRLRRRVARDLGAIRGGGGAERLRAAQLTREPVLACAVRLLDLGFFRIGSEDYAERNSSYGLTTMLREHVTISGDELVFDFPAKSGRRRVMEIADRDALAIVAALKRRRAGDQLLAFRANGGWVDCSAEQVNAYIADHARGSFTAKDFRTWNATVLAAVSLALGALDDDEDDGGGAPASRSRRDRRVAGAMRTVADYLGNTPAVCRASYVDPRVIDRYHGGATIAAALKQLAGARRDLAPDLGRPRVRRRVETAVLELLQDA